MGAEDLDRLAQRLGQPPAALGAFSRLTPEQLELLRQAVEDAYDRRRRTMTDAVHRALPGPAGRILLRLLRDGPG